MTSWSKYGEKNGKVGKGALGFLGHARIGSFCVRQGATPRAIALYKTCEVVVWWTTPVEIASALARLVRMKQLNSTDSAKAHKLASALADTWSVIQPSDAVRQGGAPRESLRFAGGRRPAVSRGIGMV
jgi:hypothetical protein